MKIILFICLIALLSGCNKKNDTLQLEKFGVVSEADLMGGTRGWVKMDTADIDKLSLEDFAVLFKFVKEKGYNAFSIIGNDGTGVLVSSGYASFGYIDEKDGALYDSWENSRVLFYNSETGEATELTD